MLTGEHAVLYGHRALVAAINRRMHVELSVLPGKLDLVIESALGDYGAPLETLPDHPKFRFMLEAVRTHRHRLPAGVGVRMRVSSEFPSEIGLGSSAAVVAATHAALLNWMDEAPPEPMMLFEHARKTVVAVQGCGSGADVAASVFGGLVAYTTKPAIQSRPFQTALTAFYCGHKKTTREVVQMVEQRRLEQPERYASLFERIDACTGRAIHAVRVNDPAKLGQAMTDNQELMELMGLNTPELDAIVTLLKADEGVCGAKISGSGLGDCAVGLGAATIRKCIYPVYWLQVDPQGCVQAAIK